MVHNYRTTIIFPTKWNKNVIRKMAGLFMWPRKIYYMYKTHSVKCSSIMLEQKAELAADASEQNNRETVHYIHSTAQLGTARPAVGSALALLCRRTIISYVLVLLLAKHLKIFAIISYRAHKCTHVNCPTLNTHHTLKNRVLILSLT